MIRPPFCPHRSCPAHWKPPRTRWWSRNGSYRSLVVGPVQRFRCLRCRRGFSERTFSLDYYAKRTVDYRRLLGMAGSCMGVRQMARHLRLSTGTIDNRLMRLCRQGLSVQVQLTDGWALAENVCADGLQSYWVSQYVPNTISVLAGADSRYLYSWNAVSLRRSGSMRDAQRRRRAELEEQFRADPEALTHAAGDLCDTLTRLIEAGEGGPITLHTDCHTSYRNAIAAHGPWHLRAARQPLVHQRTSSRAARIRSNPLAPINTIDRQIRIDLAEHVRQTVRFARNPNRSMERFSVWALAYNYRKRCHINQPVADTTTHAEAAGMPRERIREAMRQLFRRRRFLSHTPILGQLRCIWLRMYERPFLRGEEYLPRYLLA